MTKDIEPILKVLSHYLQHLVLTKDEASLLRSWLMASEANQELFDDISNPPKWARECPADIYPGLAGSMQRIRMRIMKDIENE